jgi:Holliday junction resolvase RusA-like endonuclease
MTEQFKINARLHQIVNVHRANNEIIFVSADRLTDEFRALRSKRITLLVAETNGHQPAQGALPLPIEESPKPETILITIPGQPIGKPRMTAADRWRQRDCVLRYRAWADRARDAAEGKLPKNAEAMTMRFYLQMPDSWPTQKRLQHDGQRCFQKPDIDNLCKSVMDSLLGNDEVIAKIEAEKFWTLDNPRTEVVFI